MKIYQYLNRYSLQELRKLGAFVGVKSPTSLSKEALRNDIVRLIASGAAPEPKSKAGRPGRNLIVHAHESEHMTAVVKEMKDILAEEPIPQDMFEHPETIHAQMQTEKDDEQERLLKAHLTCLKLSLGIKDNRTLIKYLQAYLKRNK